MSKAAKKRPLVVGDVVRLKSGGPPMTIHHVRHTHDDPEYWCKWFDGRELKSGDFAAYTIRRSPCPKP